MKNLIRILRFAKGYRLHAILNILFNLLSTLFSLFSMTMIIPFLDLIFLKKETDYQQFIEKGVPVFDNLVQYGTDSFNYYLSLNFLGENGGQANALIFLCEIIVFMFFFKNLFRYLALYIIAPLRSGVMLALRNSIYSKIVELPLSYFSEEKKGDIITKAGSDVQEIEWTVLQSLEMIFKEPVTIIVFLGTMVYWSPKLTLFVFIFLPVSGLIVGGIGRSLRKISGDAQSKLGQLMSTLEETLSGLRIVQGFNAEPQMKKRFFGLNNEYKNLIIKMYHRRDLASPVSEFLGVIIMVVVMWFGGNMVLEGDGLSAANFIAYIALFSQITSPAKSITTAYYNIQKGAASEERIQEIVGADVSIKDCDQPKTIDVFNSEIEYKNVWFKYKDVDVLKDISFTLEKGKTIALVGASGGGKSTIADLVPRFYDPYKGEILLDGINLKDASLKSLRNQLGIVTQDSILFNDSIKNNISFGDVNATKEQIIEAAKIANAHEFIVQMEQGYDTNIGDSGNKLSGGQKQRLSIARAILKNPPVLILDEATSALDTESERLVQDALNKLMQNRTSLVIAHRLSTIQNADEILVMEKGEIVERGNHAQLIQLSGVYKKLCDMQSFA
jgi:subfamily B ATP-binding cassette protein MsbA